MRVQFLLISFTLMVSVPAMAQVQSVRDTHANGLKPLGVKAGALLFHPSLEISEEYANNIYASANNEQSDFITTIKPDLSLGTNWSRHYLGLNTSAEFGVYADNEDENYDDYNLRANGRYDIAEKTYFVASMGYERTHERRDSPNDINSDEPTKIHVKSARLKFTRALAKIKLYLHGALREYEFENTSAGGTFIDNSFRNRLHKEAGIRIAYETMPQSEFFVQTIYDERKYETSSRPDRSSNGVRLRLGYARDITGKLSGEIYGGHMKQNYDSGFNDINTPDYGASLLWNATSLTSIYMDLNRGIYETITPGVSGYVETLGAIGVDHAFEDNILGYASASYGTHNYIGIDRDDDIMAAKLGVDYTPFRGMETGIAYSYKDRASDAALQDYKAHSIMLRAKYGL